MNWNESMISMTWVKGQNSTSFRSPFERKKNETFEKLIGGTYNYPLNIYLQYFGRLNHCDALHCEHFIFWTWIFLLNECWLVDFLYDESSVCKIKIDELNLDDNSFNSTYAPLDGSIRDTAARSTSRRRLQRDNDVWRVSENIRSALKRVGFGDNVSFRLVFKRCLRYGLICRVKS